MKAEIVPISAATSRDDNVDEIKLGQWYWLKVQESDDDDREKKSIVKKLCCAVYIGSNYAELQTAGGNKYHSQSSWRVHFNEWDALCDYEANPEIYIHGKIEHHQERVRELLGEVQRVTISLGIVDRLALTDTGADPSMQALAAASSQADVQAHKQALIVAKKETLPELFKKIEHEHESMAVWMKAEMMPAKAAFALSKQSIDSIDDRIFTVELYAGLVERLEQVREGEPAPNDTKVSVFQRRHYMDEECLANYEAGGMDYKSIWDFAQWLGKPENFGRVLPKPRSIVAFRVRRNCKHREVDLSNFIQVAEEEKADKQTYLFIRNGEQLWIMCTEVEFDSQLFPDQDHEVLLGAHTGDLWVKDTSKPDANDIITDAQHQHMLDNFAEAMAEYPAKLKEWGKRKAAYKKAKKLWDALSDEERAERERCREDGTCSHQFHRPHNADSHWAPDRPHMRDNYERVTPESTLYDDAMRAINKMTAEHNRIATVLQGLLDRSPCLHPHPPWRIWTPEGFQQGIELIYDDSRAITTGDDVINFEQYRAQLNQSIKPGSLVVGQEDAWLRAEAVKYNARQDRRWNRSTYERTHYRPHGNPGPGYIAKVVKVQRNGDCVFKWTRERERAKSYSWENDEIAVNFTCPSSALLNVSAYTPGDYKLFFQDPRTRADYLQWAPFLLAAEDHHAGKTRKR